MGEYSINKVIFLPKGSAIGSAVYSCTFFKEISSDDFFHVSEDCQHHLLYSLPRPELILYQRVIVFPLHRLSFRLRSSCPTDV